MSGLVLCVDPGLANTGVVLMDRISILEVWTLKTKSDGPRPKFTDALERAQDQFTALLDITIGLDAGVPIVAESYRDIPGHLRGATNRWTTPLLLGVISPLVDTWQDPEIVGRAYAGLRNQWAAAAVTKRDVTLKDDHLLKNEHVRSAAAHGMFYMQRLRVAS